MLLENSCGQLKMIETGETWLRPNGLFGEGTRPNFADDLLLVHQIVVAVERDERNQGVLENNFLTYRSIKRPVTIVGKAVSDPQS